MTHQTPSVCLQGSLVEKRDKQGQGIFRVVFGNKKKRKDYLCQQVGREESLEELANLGWYCSDLKDSLSLEDVHTPILCTENPLAIGWWENTKVGKWEKLSSVSCSPNSWCSFGSQMTLLRASLLIPSLEFMDKWKFKRKEIHHGWYHR